MKTYPNMQAVPVEELKKATHVHVSPEGVTLLGEDDPAPEVGPKGVPDPL